MNSFSELCERFSPSCWAMSGLTAVDSMPSQDPVYRRVVDHGTKAAMMVLAFAAGGIFSSDAIASQAGIASSAPAISDVMTYEKDEISPRHWSALMSKMKSAKRLDESPYDFEPIY